MKIVFTLLLVSSLSILTIAQREVIGNRRSLVSLQGWVKKVVVEPTEKSLGQEWLMLETTIKQNGEEIPRLIKIVGLDTSSLAYSDIVNKEVVIAGRVDFENWVIWPIEPVKIVSELNQTRPGKKAVAIPSSPVLNLDLSSKEGPVILGQLLNLPPATSGVQGVLVVPFNFTNDTSQPLSREALESRVFTGNPAVNGQYSFNNYLVEASYGRYRIAGEVRPYTTLNHTNENCTQNMTTVWFNELMDTIPADIRAQYRRYVFYWPQISGCSFGPAATLGIKGDTTLNNYAWVPMTPTSVTEMAVFLNFVAHENGHMSGLAHAGVITRSGQIWESSDRSALMTDRLRFPNIYERLGLGWVSGRVTYINNRGTYTIPLVSPAVGWMKTSSQTVIIPLYNADGTPSGNVRLLEIRKSLNFYEQYDIQYGAFTKGISIRDAPQDVVPNQNRSLLIDLVEESPPRFHNAPLMFGLSEFDQQWGVDVTFDIVPTVYNTKVRVTQHRGP